MENEGLQGARDPSNPTLLFGGFGEQTPLPKSGTGQRNHKRPNTPGERRGKEGKRAKEGRRKPDTK